jgi:hypothetical protein
VEPLTVVLTADLLLQIRLYMRRIKQQSMPVDQKSNHSISHLDHDQLLPMHLQSRQSQGKSSRTWDLLYPAHK